MKQYNLTIGGQTVEVFQDDDGKFIKPDIVKDLESYGSDLKPAHEPIVLARCPLSEKTIATNVLKWGTGGLNIDGCRVATEDTLSIGSNNRVNGAINFGMKDNKDVQGQHSQGRFPANLILSYPEDEYTLREDVTPEQLIELGEWLNENA